MAHLGSFVLLTGVGIFWYKYRGADWFIGFLSTLIGFNLIGIIVAHAVLPRAVAKAQAAQSSSVAELSTGSDGFTYELGSNRTHIDWSAVKYLWLQESFIVFGLTYFVPLHLPTDGMTPEVRADFEAKASLLSAYLSLRRSPWSGQLVSRPIRWCAWFFVACAGYSWAILLWILISIGVPDSWSLPWFVTIVVGAMYITALFAFAAIHGRAPSGWIPWRHQRDMS
jgi:hypothetical protein